MDSSDNMRYAADWCIYGFPTFNEQVLSNPCIETCSLVATTLETNILTPNTSSPYDYCQGGPTFLTNLSSCAFCQSLVPNRIYISNFLKTLKTICQSQPSPSTAFPISPLQIFTLQPPASYSSTKANPSTTHGLSRGAKIAIGVIVPLVILPLLALFGMYWHRRYKSSTSTANRYRPQQSSLDERWGDAQISRPAGGSTQYASANISAANQSYFQSTKDAAHPHHSSVPLESHYPPVPIPPPDHQPQLPNTDPWRHVQPSTYGPSRTQDASDKGKSRDPDTLATTPPAQAEPPSKKGIRKSVRGLTPMIGKKPKVSIDTASVARGRNDLEESPSDLFG
ncbi:MAG: hypothetical protein LQ347_003760 [Umbilicaria vellea]|nr:MAG: hypothetical protein LQ347_003760 [Umbilicaria vellea]